MTLDCVNEYNQSLGKSVFIGFVLMATEFNLQEFQIERSRSGPPEQFLVQRPGVGVPKSKSDPTTGS